MRYPLVEGHGNFGNIDGDKAAAYRYTEARLARLADEMTRDIEKNVVDFTPNFDNKRQEPTVLPSRIPNLLVNGSVGIAVGMATNIPPHNLGEVIDGTIYLMEHPDASVSDLMAFIKGPDFPTRAMICGSMGIREAYETGRGKLTVRARAEVEEDKHRIVITEIPYQVNKSTLVEAMAECHKDKRIEGITDIRDESGRAGLRIVVEYRRDANGQVILNQLYKYTQLQDTFAVNMLAICDGVPKLLNLRDILRCYIAHQESVIERRIRFDLDKALRELHINEGYKIAADHIEEIIKLIRASDSIPSAKTNLMERYGLSDAQAQAIVEMTLGRLSGLERQKVLDRIAKLTATVSELRTILASEEGIKGVIRDELLAIKARFGDDRRTELVPMENEIVLEDLIERHTCVITMSHAGYIKRQASSVYSAQHRGGKGIIGMGTKEEDYIERMLAVGSHSYLLMFTSKGRVYVKKAYAIPEAGRTAKGTNIVNILDLAPDERVTAMVAVDGFDSDKYLTMVTLRGVIKRTPLREFEIQRRGGKIALSLDEGDSLLYVRLTDENSRLLIATRKGYAVFFRLSDIRPLGRTARGVKAISLSEGDEVRGAAVADENKRLLTVTETGYGKRTPFDDYPMHKRGGKGVRCHNTERRGMIAGIETVGDDDDIMLITSTGTIIRTPASDIPEYSRTAGGVIIMRTAEDAGIVNFTCLPAVEDEPDETVDGSPEENADVIGAEGEDNAAETDSDAEEVENIGNSDESEEDI